MIYDLAIIGAGASGLIAGIAALEKNPGAAVVIFEKNDKAAKKIYATGNGRCNYLNRNICKDAYMSGESSAAEFAEIVFSSEPLKALESFFETLGIVPYTDEEGRMYPRSMQAESIASALEYGFAQRGGKLVLNAEIKDVQKEKDLFVIGKDKAKKLLVACGGKAGIQYGSSGDGYKLAKSFGHSVVKPIPALTQILAEGTEELSGVRAKAEISVFEDSKLLAKDSGELQFTKDSLSGICSFNVSRFLRFKENASYEASLDLFEEYSHEALKDLLNGRKGLGKGRLYKGLLPDKLASYIENNNLDPKDLRFKINGSKGFKDAQVTSGGVSLDEVDPNTMQSKLCENLYFAGEVLDIDAYCGGFNLGFAWASGIIAGKQIDA